MGLRSRFRELVVAATIAIGAVTTVVPHGAQGMVCEEDDCRRPPPRPASPGITVMLDGTIVGLSASPVLQNGRMLVPLAGIVSHLGGSLVWDDAYQMASLTVARRGPYYTDRILLTEGSHLVRYLTIGGTPWAPDRLPEVTLRIDVAPQRIGGRLFVPVRLVTDLYDAYVNWEPRSQTLSIETNTPATTLMQQDHIYVTEGGEFAVASSGDIYPYYPATARSLLSITSVLNRKVRPYLVWDPDIKVDPYNPRVRVRTANKTAVLDIYADQHIVWWFMSAGKADVYTWKLRNERDSLIEGGVLSVGESLVQGSVKGAAKSLVKTLAQYGIKEFAVNRAERCVEQAYATAQQLSLPALQMGIVETPFTSPGCVPEFTDKPIDSNGRY